MSEEYKITTGKITGETLQKIDLESSIIIDGKSYTSNEFNEAVEMLKQPQLNENQQIVLEHLQKMWKGRPIIGCFPFSFVGTIAQQFDDIWDTLDSYQRRKAAPYLIAYGTLSAEMQLQVMEAFSRWALKQEEIK